MNDTTIFQTDKWSSHFIKRNTFQSLLCDSESGSLVMLYLQCNKSNAYHWYAFDSQTYRLNWYYHHAKHRMYNRWFCAWVTQMLLYSEIQIKLIWKLWKQLHADLSVALESSQHGLNSHSRAALPICKLSYGMMHEWLHVIPKPVTLLVSVDQLIDLQLTSNSIWFHELMKIFYENVDAYW